MATGSGKTRTVIALCDVLMRCNWAKRILFLADRVALVNQAVGAFKKHLRDASPVNLVTEKDTDGRVYVYVSTYPTMMRLIEATNEGQRRFGPGHFDLIIIDEANSRCAAPPCARCRPGNPCRPRNASTSMLATRGADHSATSKHGSTGPPPVRPVAARSCKGAIPWPAGGSCKPTI